MDELYIYVFMTSSLKVPSIYYQDSGKRRRWCENVYFTLMSVICKRDVLLCLEKSHRINYAYNTYTATAAVYTTYII